MELSATEMLARLVAFPSASTESNLPLIDFVREYLVSWGVASTLVPSEDGAKANLFATVGPQTDGGVVLSGHTDVVPALEDGWTHSPWRLTERNGRLYGRGSCDMKGFNALALAAVPGMLAANLKSPLHIALSYDEEIGCLGAPRLAKKMAATIRPPRAVFVGEPTRMQVVRGHKGMCALEVCVRGHAVHSSRIDKGVSAVMTGARLVNWLTNTMGDNRTRACANGFEPPYTTLHCGVFNGGTAGNIVAEDCRFIVDIRAIPQEDPLDFRDRFIDFARTVVKSEMHAIHPDTGIDITTLSSIPGLAPEKNGSAEALAQKLSGHTDTIVAAYGTEAGIFQDLGWSTVVIGPGDIDQAHKADEYIEVAQMIEGQRFIERLIGEQSAT